MKSLILKLVIVSILTLNVFAIAEEVPKLEDLIASSPGSTDASKQAYRDKVDKMVKHHAEGDNVPAFVNKLSSKWMALSPQQTKIFFDVVDKYRISSPKFNTAMKTSFKKNLLDSDAKINPCEYMCSIFEGAGAWAKKGAFDMDSVPMDHQTSAYQTLGLLFMIKANKFCGKDKKYFFGLCDKSQVNCKEISATWGGNIGKTTCPKLDIDNVGALDEDDVTKLVGDVSKILKKSGTSSNQFEMYTNVYNLKIIKELIGQMQGFKKSKKNTAIIDNLKKQEKEVNARIDRDLTAYETLETGSFGSLLNNYALGVAVEASDDKESSAIKYMEKVAEKNKTNPSAVPYSVGHQLTSGNPRSGGARAVPFYLALWEKQEKDSDGEKKHRNNLIKVLDNYTTLLPDLIAVLGSKSAHVGKDHLAPYYFYSTLPYATAAIQKLRQKGNLTKKEKAIVENLEKTVGQAIKAVKKSKDAKAQNDEWWGGGSQGYVNPLLGLTLMPMCEGSKGKGILD